MKTRKVIRLAGAAVLGCSLCVTARAVTISGLVETQNSLTFEFSGEGWVDWVYAGLPPLTYWSDQQLTETHYNDWYNGVYGFHQFGWQHLPDGPEATVGGYTVYGQTLSDTQTLPHGTGTDTYSLTITVNQGPDGLNPWGTFAGSFSAIHTGTAAPDGGSTALLAGLGWLVVAGARKLFCSC